MNEAQIKSMVSKSIILADELLKQLDKKEVI